VNDTCSLKFDGIDIDVAWRNNKAKYRNEAGGNDIIINLFIDC